MNGIGVDVGSSSLKVVMVTDTGEVLARASHPLVTNHIGEKVTQNPKKLWLALQRVLTDLVAENPAGAAGVTDIGVCSQYSSVVPVDDGGVPVGPIVMYMDRRGTDLCWQILERHPEAFEVFVERHGIPPIGAGLTLSHILAIEAEEPEVAGSTADYLEVMDFVNLLLTGRACATQATMFASQLCDNRIIGTTEYDELLVSMAGIDPARLPELVELSTVVGEVRDSVADKLGLPHGIRVHAGMNDTQAAAFATGVMHSKSADGSPTADSNESGHSVGIAIGTTSVVIDSADRHAVDLDHEVLSMPAPLAGKRLVMAENGVAGRSVEHFFELMDIDAFNGDTIKTALESSKPGASGLLFMPWLDGSMAPAADASVRGGLIGLSLTTTRSDLIRAALEGTSLNLAWLLPAVESLTGRNADRIVFTGGAARSTGWAQVLADVTQRSVDVVTDPSFAAATAVARVVMCSASGEDPGMLSPPIARSVEPDRSLSGLYESLGEQFRSTFSMSRGICEALGHG
ncbi:MAG: hypothetical protein KDB26_12495 [Microthrixaceae bacterium]|nr:hypothetical protein [Microthrixaceae bacterium]